MMQYIKIYLYQTVRPTSYWRFTYIKRYDWHPIEDLLTSNCTTEDLSNCTTDIALKTYVKLYDWHPTEELLTSNYTTDIPLKLHQMVSLTSHWRFTYIKLYNWHPTDHNISSGEGMLSRTTIKYDGRHTSINCVWPIWRKEYTLVNKDHLSSHQPCKKFHHNICA